MRDPPELEAAIVEARQANPLRATRMLAASVIVMFLALAGGGVYLYLHRDDIGHLRGRVHRLEGARGPAGAPGASTFGRPGRNGRDGRSGRAGAPGKSVVLPLPPRVVVQRVVVHDGLRGAIGPKGDRGKQGAKGERGEKGDSVVGPPGRPPTPEEVRRIVCQVAPALPLCR